jgi:hypothetical protein
VNGPPTWKRTSLFCRNYPAVGLRHDAIGDRIARSPLSEKLGARPSNDDDPRILNHHCAPKGTSRNKTIGTGGYLESLFRTFDYSDRFLGEQRSWLNLRRFGDPVLQS